jgi:hypothetical protein
MSGRVAEMRVASEGVVLGNTSLEVDGLYRVVLRLHAPSRLIPDMDSAPAREIALLGRRIRINTFRTSSADRQAEIELEVTTDASAGPSKAGTTVPVIPSSVSWDVVITGVVAAAAAVMTGGWAAVVFAAGWGIVTITRLVRGGPGGGDDLKPPGLKFGFGLGAALAVAGVAFLFLRGR